MTRTSRLSAQLLRSLIALAGSGALAGCGVLDRVFEPPADAGSSQVQLARPELDPIDSNRFSLAPDADAVGEIQVIETRHEDTFVDIARTYGLGFDELIQANPDVDPWLPGEGTRVILPTRYVLPESPREGIVLNIAAKRLFYFPEIAKGETPRVETYPIGIGRTGWATPTGDTTIISRARDPVWFVPASIRKEHAEAGDPLPAQVSPGPDNPLGAHVLALGIPGYLIHGTNKPAGVGMRVSHGCVRLFPEDIASLYDRVADGTRVRIVNQPYLLGWDDGDLLLEAHPPMEEDERDWSGSLDGRARARLVNRSKYPGVIDAERVAEIADAALGLPVSILASGSDSNTTLRDARRVRNTVRHDLLADMSSD